MIMDKIKLSLKLEPNSVTHSKSIIQQNWTAIIIRMYKSQYIKFIRKIDIATATIKIPNIVKYCLLKY